MKKKALISVLAALMTVTLAGCAVFGGNANVNKEPLPIANGTTAGNILNYGFCVKNGDELIFMYTNGDYYPIGSTVRSNPETGESSLLMENGGLYMNLIGAELYYCKPEGVFKADIDDPKPLLVLEKDAKQLQISGGNMYYIENGSIDSRTLGGEENGFFAIKNADWLNVYGDKIYYMSTEDRYIYSADIDGNNPRLVFEHEVSMFIIMDDTIYYIDGVTGYLVKKEFGSKLAIAVVEYALKGFNINRSNIYYTRNISGIGTCCNADLDGGNEQQLSEFGESDWHIVCMYNTGALLGKIEEISTAGD